MAVSGYLGKAAYVKFGSTVLNTYYRTLTPDEEIELVEKTAGADANKTYLSGAKDGTIEGEFVMPQGSAGTAVWGAVAPGTEATLEWGPEGTASGKPKHTVNAMVRRRGKPLTYNDLSTFAVSWQMSGAVADSAYS